MIGTTAREDYRGPAAFSEPESRFVRDFARKHKIDVFVSIHSGISRVYLPFADSKVHIRLLLLFLYLWGVYLLRGLCLSVESEQSTA